MPELAFLPWISIRTAQKAGGYELIPYHRGGSPDLADAEQESVSRLLEAYLDDNGRPIGGAALVREEGRDLFQERTETERAAIFRFSEILSLVGLASRAYFGCGLAYVNRDNFRFFLQAFNGESSDVTAVGRRRDGSTRSYVARGLYKVPWPEHVPSSLDLDMDGEFLKALLAYQTDAVDESLFAAIMSFNEANSDSPWITEQAELVWLTGAFERLFGLGKGNAHDLVRALADVWSEFSKLPREQCERLANEKERVGPLVGYWIRDLFLLRNKFAHGHRVSQYPSKWTTQEHLLLGSYCFPLTVKLKIRRSKGYSLSDTDATEILALDRLLCNRDLLTQESSDGERQSWPWAQIMGGAAWEITERKAISDLTEEPRESRYNSTTP